MQDIIDRKSPVLSGGDDNDGSDESSDEEYERPEIINTSFQAAVTEFDLFEQYKKKKYRPEIDRSKAKILSGEDRHGQVFEVLVGPVLSKGKDLPSGKNLAHYVDKRGRIDLLRFFIDHQLIFPTLFILCQCEAARKIVEVGCEHFFAVSGYVSAPRRTRLGVGTYERLSMLANILQKVYIDKQWVADEYLRRCKAGAWKEDNAEEALKCWNLERIIDAEMLGKSKPKALTMDDLLVDAETASRCDGSENEDVVILDY